MLHTVQYTVYSAGFSIFVHWKVAVNRSHNLHPCTGFLFPVYSRIYYGLYSVLYFTNRWTAHFRVRFLCTGILQRICRNSDALPLSAYSPPHPLLIYIHIFSREISSCNGISQPFDNLQIVSLKVTKGAN